MFGLRESAVVLTVDSGWRLLGESAFLMAFETRLQATVYRVRSEGHRTSREAQSTLAACLVEAQVTSTAPLGYGRRTQNG